jgi:hypothetical protein
MAEITAKRSDNAAIISNRTRVAFIHVAHVVLACEHSPRNALCDITKHAVPSARIERRDWKRSSPFDRQSLPATIQSASSGTNPLGQVSQRWTIRQRCPLPIGRRSNRQAPTSRNVACDGSHLWFCRASQRLAHTPRSPYETASLGDSPRRLPVRPSMVPIEGPTTEHANSQ